MKTKASIVTFHCVPNYGAVLQAYALQKVLETMCDEVEVLDYRPKGLFLSYKNIVTNNFFSLVKSLYNLFPFLKKKYRFNKFIKHNIKLSKETFKKLENVNCNSDYIFLGSDQIWNPDILKKLDPVYFGMFSKKAGTIVSSYAASMGKTTLNKAEMNFFSVALRELDYISVRENEAERIIRSLSDKPISVDIDPTILAGSKAFNEFIKIKKERPYVLLYSLNGRKEPLALAYKIAKYLDLDLVELSGVRKPLYINNHKTIYDAGPEEFISYIHNAEYVITDSFHGCVFSILFHIPFVTMPPSERSSRIINLLRVAGIENRIIYNFDRDVILNKIVWEKVDSNINDSRMKSLNYIRKVIGSI